MGVLWIISANFSLIALIGLLFGLLGWLWFKPGSPVGLALKDGVLSRLALYPILGWMLLLVGVNWLRIFAVPFRVSAPWLLAGLILIPSLFWLARFFKTPFQAAVFAIYLKTRIRPFFLLGGVVFIFALVPVNRLAVPSFYDAGVWGYDQVNYVHIADQYLDRGMFEPGDVPSPGVLAPWTAFNGALLKRLFSPEPFQPFSFSTNPEVASLTRILGLIMRNGGGALDASIAAWCHLDGLQAYFISGYLQYLLLVLAGIWLGLQMRLPLLLCIFLGALSGLWPMAVFPSLVDNRDQTLAFVILLILFGAVFAKSLNLWIRGLVLGAMALTYMELFPLAFFVWVLLHFDERPWLLAVKNIFLEGLVALGASLVYVPWGTHFLGMQFINSTAMKLGNVLGDQFGVISGFAGSFAGLIFPSHSVSLLAAIIAGAAMVGLQLTGLALWIRQKRYFGCAAFALFAFLILYLQHRDLTYSSYKLFTILFPMTVLLCASCGEFIGGELDGDRMALRHGRKLVVLLAILCLPAMGLGAAIRSGFEFSGFSTVQGANSTVEDRSKLKLLNGLKTRSNDIEKARQISSSIPGRSGILMANLIRFDVAYFGHFLRDRPLKLVNGLEYNEWEPSRKVLFSPRQEFLEAGDPIHYVIALGGAPSGLSLATPFSEKIEVLRGATWDVQAGRTFTSFRIDPAEGFAFVQRIFSQEPVVDLLGGRPLPSFFFGGSGIAMGVYTANMPPIRRVLTFDVRSGPLKNQQVFLKRAADWQCLVDGKAAEGWTMTTVANHVSFRIPLPASAAGNVVEIAAKDRLPINPDVVYRTRPAVIGKPGAINEIVNFALEDAEK